MRYSEILVENLQFFHTPLHSTPRLGGSRWNSATPFGTEKLEWLGYRVVKKFRRYLFSFWRNSRTRRTDRQTPGDGNSRAMHSYHRTAKTMNLTTTQRNWNQQHNGFFPCYISDVSFTRYSHFSRLSQVPKWLVKPVRCPSIHTSVQCQQFLNPKSPRPLGRCRWNLACIYYGSADTTSRKRNFEFRPLRRVGPPRT